MKDTAALQQLFAAATARKRSGKATVKFSKGADAIWMAVIGPDTPTLGEVKKEMQLWQRQFAKTGASFLGLDYVSEAEEVGKPVETMKKR